MQDALEKSDNLMAATKDLFVDFPRRRTGKIFNSNKSSFLFLFIGTKGYLEEFKIFFQALYYLYYRYFRVDSI